MKLSAGQWKLTLAGLTFGAAVLYLIYTATATSAVYYVTVGELLEQGDRAAGRPIRVSGWVLDGSIEKQDATRLDFVLTDGGRRIPVTYRGMVPDLFGYSKDDLYQEVVVEGRYVGDGVVTASNLIVKHGPEFRPAENQAGTAGVNRSAAAR